ncbi:MAG: T9SS type A sorting domain-containing protein [Flavobacteriaceae bacterium]
MPLLCILAAKQLGNPFNTSNIALEKALIYDANGRLVQQIDLRGMATERTFNVSSLASGVYMVQIQSEDAQTVKRLIRK